MRFDEFRKRFDSSARKHPSDEEHRIQVSCVRWFRMAHPQLAPRLFAVPNGGRRDGVTGARQRLQLMEHGGRMCISVDGVPLLSREQAGGDLLDTLREMRANYVVYHLGSRYE